MKRFELNRRTLLRGAGISIGLPLLEAMLPVGKSAFAATQKPTRMMAFYTPCGMYQQKFFPTSAGASYTMPDTLKPLESLRSDFLVVKNVTHFAGKPFNGGAHAAGTGSFLTDFRVGKTDNGSMIVDNRVSADQVIAKTFAGQLPFKSLQLGVDASRSDTLSCDTGYSCAYTHHISWDEQGNPMPLDVNPDAVFQKLYGKIEAGTGSGASQVDKSILDYVMSDTQKLQTKLGATDKQKLDEYLTAVRNVEQQLGVSGSGNAACASVQSPGSPSGTNDTRAESICDLMADLSVLAFQCDLTRVITLMTAQAASGRVYKQFGHGESHHKISHHGNQQTNITKLLQIEKWEMQRLAYLLQKLKDTKDVDGDSLLRSAFVFYSSEINEGHKHGQSDMPVIIAGQGNGYFKTGQSIQLPTQRDFGDLYLTFMDAMGVQRTTFGQNGNVMVSEIKV